MDDLLLTMLGGLIGGTISALITWTWTRRKWDRTALAFKTTARYVARLILDRDSVGDLREDEKGWLRGFDQLVAVGLATERNAASPVRAAKSKAVGTATERDQAGSVGWTKTVPESEETSG